ncbi:MULTISPECIES: DUF6879 family protein [unclassified Streptomyces]|uniref:DUF6879 family protein n=1 Tax=unclassified Streptomyces TaxID=2593676 RepID=UPI0016613FE5|nr:MULTISPECIES: DUF6879 family protein [unclassified Streptomyces]MBD0707404.1 hypothetical protein [Streptomyces sp. CBMA291]MBD0715144.1 hypothetical protein [Streptomyces sp. CBMA370]
MPALRFIGSTSDEGDCPTLYEIEGTDQVLVQGDRVTSPEQLAELRHVKPSETFVTVPRDLLVRFAPRATPREIIPFSEAAHLFQEFRHTAWRLETRRGYATDRRSPKWARWQAGEDISAEPSTPWREAVAAAVATGRRYERVRIVDSPMTDGQRFLLASSPSALASGEDIRLLPRADAELLNLPNTDFWLFDSRLLARLVFGDDDTTLGIILSEDPAEIAAACQARDAAWHRAIPAHDYAQTSAP